MDFRSIIFILICFSRLNSQWLSFDLSEADVVTFKKQVEPTIISVAISGGQSTMLNLTQNQRFGITFSIPMGWDLSLSSYESNPLLNPLMLEGQVLVTENLVLIGKMNIFSNSKETINAAGYGCNFISDSWATNISMGWLEGPTHLRVRYVDSSIIGKRTLAKVPILLGVGYNNYRGSIKGFDNIDIPKSIDNSISYLITGTELIIEGVNVELQVRLNSKFFQFNFTIFHLFF